MKKSLTVMSLTLCSCTYIPAPTPAPVVGDLPEKVRVLQLNQSAREQLGAREKDDLIILMGADGNVTFFGSPGLGFTAEKSKDDITSVQDSGGREIKVAKKGVVSHLTVTISRNSPSCGVAKISGKLIHYPVPDCPHPDQ